MFITPVPAGTGQPGRTVPVGQFAYPTALAFAGSTAVMLGTFGGQVRLVSLPARHVFKPIRVGNFPVAVAISGPR